MWIVTVRGMFSAVQHNDDEDKLVVRTRVYGDADHLAQILNQTGPYASLERATGPAEVISYAHSDYPFRVIVTRTEWVWFTQLCAKEVTYSNFKSAVAAKQGLDREQVYHRVWEALLGLSRLPGAKGTAKQRKDSLREAPRRAWPLLRRSDDGRDAVTAALPLDFHDADGIDPGYADEPADDAPEAAWDAYYETERTCTGCKHRHAGDCLGDCETCTLGTDSDDPALAAGMFTDRDIARQETRP